MKTLSKDISSLTPQQRALLELRLKQKRESQPRPESASNRDDENLVLAKSVESVEELLAKFYGKFPWPWPPRKFDYLEDAEVETIMLNQDVGDYRRETVPLDAKIWVAGCGTNQAINTALKFPHASVTGSDVSAKSLEVCAKNAAQLGLKNLELKEESINHVPYEEKFDYIISTGVIHHNADPKITLDKLTAALKPTGIMELMVYNRYHRTVTSAFQKAVRIFGEDREQVDFEEDFAIARKIAANFPVRETLEKGFIQYMDWSDSDFADLLIQPVEHSYTVESLSEMAASSGLELLYPCVTLYVKSLATNLSYNLEFKDQELQERYDALPDIRRWQVTNLMLHEKSPLLWFYLQRTGGRRRRTEQEVCEEFLNTRFEQSQTALRSYMLEEDGRYVLSPNAVPYPNAPIEPFTREIYQAVDGELEMRTIFERLGIPQTFQKVNKARTTLTTTAYPYLKAVQ